MTGGKTEAPLRQLPPMIPQGKGARKKKGGLWSPKTAPKDRERVNRTP